MLVPLSGEVAAGHAKSPIDRIGHFIFDAADQAS
jgi:hypothetical protein